MNNLSKRLNVVLSNELKEGNSIDRIIEEYSSLANTVIFMEKPISKNTSEMFCKTEIAGLKCWKYQGSPQNPPDQGIMDEMTHQAIIFPVKDMNGQ